MKVEQTIMEAKPKCSRCDGDSEGRPLCKPCARFVVAEQAMGELKRAA